MVIYEAIIAEKNNKLLDYDVNFTDCISRLYTVKTIPPFWGMLYLFWV